MSDYIGFKCSDCSIDAPSLEALECHIWNRHIKTFQYNCAVCSWPALSAQALQQHFLAEHQSCGEVEFKRKLSLDMRLREMISASVIVSLYEDDQLYEQNEVPQVDAIEGDGNEDTIGHTIPVEEMEVIHNQTDLIEEVPPDAQLIFVPKDYPCDGWDDAVPESSMMNIKEEVVTLTDETGNLVDCEPDDAYPIYSGHDLLDESFQYVDEEGNTVYVTDQYPFEEEEKLNGVQRRAAKHRHIDSVVNEIAQNSKKKRPTTMWTCPDCHRVIKYPSKIEEHKRMHAGEKPFTCKYCSAKFAHKGALKCHERSHEGDRPYACTWDCGKTFVSASAQRMHERYHSGQKPFMCSFCGRLFGKRSHLIRHESQVHMGETMEEEIEPRGLEVAGSSKRLLEPIVEGIIEEVKDERVLRRIKRDPMIRTREEEIV